MSSPEPDTGPNLSGAVRLRFLDRLVRREVRVRRIEEVTPHYRRIVVGGDDLARGYPQARFAPGDHVKVYFPHPDTGRLVAYRDIGDDAPEWVLDDEEAEPIRRDYTPRAWDPGNGELTLDFVLHEHGVAGRWAGRARVGDRLVIIGPRANWLLPENFSHYLAFGDETAIPAISRLVEEAPVRSRVSAFLEVADEGEEQSLGEGTGHRIHWVHRTTATVAPGHLSALETAVLGAALPDDLTDLFVFGAGEATRMRPIRRHFRTHVGLSRDRVAVDGYWRQGADDFDHHTVADD